MRSTHPILARLTLVLVLGMSACSSVPPPPTASLPAGTASPGPVSSPAAAACHLGSPAGAIGHVVYVQFDNVHFNRDTPNVPSDLEQMPHLLAFLSGNGIVLADDHTALISHTGTGFLTALTGLYPDKLGQPISNSFRYFMPSGATSTASTFAYWTSPLYDSSQPSSPDKTPNLIGPAGKIPPAPWVPFTRAGCSVGAIGVSNMVLENAARDLLTVFGSGSPQTAEVRDHPDTVAASYVGIAVHCAQGATLCSLANGGVPDRLPDEPGGYNGFMALFGDKYVGPQIAPSGKVTDFDGKTIADSRGNPGFPGFDNLSPSVALAYAAAMLEHGVPVTYVYLSDAHDPHPGSQAFGPGEAGYVAQLKAYDAGFAAFFDRLAKDGLNASNTLFVFTADEGDHFAGGAPEPAGCDGISTACTYSHKGEVSINTPALLASVGYTGSVDVRADAAPSFYIPGDPPPNSAAARELARALGRLQAANPYTGKTEAPILSMADPAEMQLLHLVTADPARTPTLQAFAGADYRFEDPGSGCSGSACVFLNPRFAWNHGTIAPDIVTTWAGLAGPGVRKAGVDRATWADHTDLRPTMLAVLGLHDDYAADGRALFEALDDAAVPPAVRANRETWLSLARMYKQLNAPLGSFGTETLRISTAALRSDTPGDAAYGQAMGRLTDLGRRRDALSAEMITALRGTAFSGAPFDDARARGLVSQAGALLDEVKGIP